MARGALRGVFSRVNLGVFASSDTSNGGERSKWLLFIKRKPLFVFLFRYSVVWLILGGGMSSEGAKTVLVAAIISVVIPGDDGAPIAGFDVKVTSMILWGRRSGSQGCRWPGNLVPITERIAYDRGAKNGVVEAGTPVAGVGFSISVPKSKANAGVSGVVTYFSANEMMCDGGYVGTTGRPSKPSERGSRNRARFSALIDQLCLGVRRRNRPQRARDQRRHPRRGRVQCHPGGRIGRQGCRYMVDTTSWRRRLSRSPCQYSRSR